MKTTLRLLALVLTLGLAPAAPAQTIVPPREATTAQVAAGTAGNVFISPRRLADTDAVLADVTVAGDDIFGVLGLNITASQTTNKNLTLSSSGTGNIVFKYGGSTFGTMTGSTGVFQYGGTINAAGLQIGGVPVSTSSDTFWVSDTGGIKYTAGPVSLNGTPTGDAGDLQAEDLTLTGNLFNFSGATAAITMSAASTSQKYLRMNSTGGDLYLGIEGSTGGTFFTSAGNYESVFYSPNNNSYFRTPKARFSGYLDLDTNTSFSTLSATGARIHAQTAWGAVLGGYGTTNDVSLFNRAGGLALSVPANTTNVNIAGTLTINGTATPAVVAATSTDANYKATLSAEYTDTATTKVKNKTLTVFSSGTADGTKLYGGDGTLAQTMVGADSTLSGNLTVTGTGTHTFSGTELFTRTGLNTVGVASVATLRTDAKTVADGLTLPFQMQDSGSAVQTYASIRADIVDPTAGSEDGKVVIAATTAGATAVDVATFAGTGTTVATNLAVNGTGDSTYAGNVGVGMSGAATQAKMQVRGTGADPLLRIGYEVAGQSYLDFMRTAVDATPTIQAGYGVDGTNTLALNPAGGSVSVGGNFQLGTASGNDYIIKSGNASATGSLTIQAGAGSALYGGSVRLYSGTHASRPGWVWVGLGSNTAGRKFVVSETGLDGGSELFSVDALGSVTAAGTGSHVFGTTNTVTMAAGVITAAGTGSHVFGTTNTVTMAAGVITTATSGSTLATLQRTGSSGGLTVFADDTGPVFYPTDNTDSLRFNTGGAPAVTISAARDVTLANALGVASGGTGAATHTANAVLLGNGTSALQAVAPGTSGNVLTSNGTTWQSTAPATANYAEIYVANGTTGQSIPTGATYTKLTGFTTDGAESGSNADVASDKITFTVTGTYRISWGMSITSDTNNVTWEVAPFLAGVEKTNGEASRRVGTGADVGDFGRTCVLTVSSVPVDLDLRAKHNLAGTVILTPVHMNLNVQKIQ